MFGEHGQTSSKTFLLTTIVYICFAHLLSTSSFRLGGVFRVEESDLSVLKQNCRE